ncbi:closca [Arctopsyche grandis]|uniref:closca n=1 Tax=Arctopsyche grandis TaxID=121162 RepID=UPI00406DA14A
MRAFLVLGIFVIFMKFVEIRTTKDYIEYVTLNFYNSVQHRYDLKSQNDSKNYENIAQEITNFHEIALRKPRNVKEYVKIPPNQETNLHQLTVTDVYRFIKFEEISILKSRFILDITIFSHKRVDMNEYHWYAAVLEEEHQTEKCVLVIYQFLSNSNSWKIIQEETVYKSSAIRSVAVTDGTLLVTGGKYKKLNYELFTDLTVYMLNDNNKLTNIQTLKTELFSDFELWSDLQNIFLIVAIDHKKLQNEIKYEFKNPLYIWKGNHFDILQYLSTSNVRKITPFQIGAKSYISVANYKNNFGETKIFSEIFKYNPQVLEYISIQKLPTSGATHVQYFSFQWGTLIETFIIIVNKYDFSQRNEFYVNSIIYKYEGGLFIPFQNLLVKDIEKWLPIMGNKNKFLLVGISNYGKIQIYQYNGWRFVNTLSDFSMINSIPGDKKIKSFMFYENPILVVFSNNNGESITLLYEPLFTTINPIEDIKTSISTWSNKVQQTLHCSNEKYFKSSSSTDHILKVLDKYHELNNSTNYKIELRHAKISSIETNSVYSKDFEFNHIAVQNINNILSSLQSQLSSVKSLSDILSLTLLNDGNVLTKSLQIENIRLACLVSPCYLNQLNMSNLNKKDIVRYQNEIIYIQSGFSDYKEVDINKLIINYKFNVHNLNNKPIETIKKFIQNLAETVGVVVKGTIFMDKGFSLSGELNDMKINDETVLCKNVDQHLSGHFVIPKLHSAILDVPQINDLNMDDFKNLINNENKTVSSIYYLSKVTVDDVILKNVFNGISFDSLKEGALKQKGTQDIKGQYNIIELKTKSVSIAHEKTRNMLMNNFIKINDGSYNIKNGVYLSMLNASDLEVGKRLNNIPIVDGNLQVLLLNSPNNQKLTAAKLFENVELMGPVNLLGKINRGILERKNPVSMIEESLTLKGDYVIHGNVSIEMIMNCENLIDSNNDQSLKQLQLRALKLFDTNIEIPLVFSQPLDTKILNCDSINGINPVSWISTENENAIPVSGKKSYLNNLQINGYMNMNFLTIGNLFYVTDISGMNVNDIESKENWSKEIYFKRPIYFNSPINIDSIYFTTSITGVSKADFGNSWLLAEDDQILHGRSNFNRISCLNAIDIEFGKINDIDIESVSKNAVWINDDHQLGTIIYEGNIVVNKSMYLHGFMDYIAKPENILRKTSNKIKFQHVVGPKKIMNDVYVDAKILTNYLRNISLDYFCSLMKPKENYVTPSLIIDGNLVMMHEPYVDMLWNSSVNEIIDNAWFKNTKFTAKKNMFFNNVIFKNEIILQGSINNIDYNWILNNFVSLSGEQNLSGPCTIDTVYADLINVGQQTMVKGLVQSINLESIYMNTLKTHSNQELWENLKFDTVTVDDDMILYGTINYINLANDLMQVNAKPNIVDGYKSFHHSDVKIDYVFSKYIQNTDMSFFFDNSAQRNKENFLHFKDSKFLKYATFKNLNIEETLNNKSTNYLYVNGELQEIFGKKYFQANDNTYLRNIVAKSTINDLNITHVYQNLIFKTSTEMTITAPKVLLNSIYSKNVIIDGLFNDRKFDEIVTGIEYTSNNYYINKFESLIGNSSVEIERYIKNKSSKLHDFQLHTIVRANIEAIVSFQFMLDNYLAIAIRTPNKFSVISMYKWSIEKNSLVPDLSIAPLYFDESISKLFVIEMTNHPLLFVETVLIEYNQYRSFVFNFEPQQGFIKMQEMPSNITVSVVPVKIEHQVCVIIVGVIGPAYLHCLVESQNYLRMYRPTSIYNSTQVEILNVNGVLHLVVNKVSGIEILNWEKSDHRKLAVLQHLPAAMTFSVKMWNNDSYLATGNSNKVQIYRFNKNLQRFVEILSFEHLGNIRKVNFNVISETSLMLSVVVQETQYTDQLFTYTYDGLAGFRLSFIKYLQFSFIKDIITLRKHNLFVMALALYDEISVIKFSSMY